MSLIQYGIAATVANKPPSTFMCNTEYSSNTRYVKFMLSIQTSGRKMDVQAWKYSKCVRTFVFWHRLLRALTIPSI